MTRDQGSNWIRKDKRLAIYLRDNWLCVYCGKSLKRSKPKYRTLDHVIPVINGGTNDPENLVTCCLGCNVLKGGKHIIDFCKFRPEVSQRVMLALVKPIDRQLAKDILSGKIDAYSKKGVHANKPKLGGN